MAPGTTATATTDAQKTTAWYFGPELGTGKVIITGLDIRGLTDDQIKLDYQTYRLLVRGMYTPQGKKGGIGGYAGVGLAGMSEYKLSWDPIAECSDDGDGAGHPGDTDGGSYCEGSRYSLISATLNPADGSSGAHVLVGLTGHYMPTQWFFVMGGVGVHSPIKIDLNNPKVFREDISGTAEASWEDFSFWSAQATGSLGVQSRRLYAIASGYVGAGASDHHFTEVADYLAEDATAPSFDLDNKLALTYGGLLEVGLRFGRYGTTPAPEIGDPVIEETASWDEMIKEIVGDKVKLEKIDENTIVLNVSRLDIKDSDNKKILSITIKRNPEANIGADNAYIVSAMTTEGPSGDPRFTEKLSENELKGYIEELFNDLIKNAIVDPHAVIYQIYEGGWEVYTSSPKVKSGENISLAQIHSLLSPDELPTGLKYTITVYHAPTNTYVPVSTGKIADDGIGNGRINLSWSDLTGDKLASGSTDDFQNITPGTYNGNLIIAADGTKISSRPISIQFTVEASYPTVTAVVANVPPGASPYEYDPINVDINMSGPGKIKVTLPNGYSQDFDVTAAEINSGKYTAKFAGGVRASRTAPPYRTNTTNMIGFVSVSVVGSSAPVVNSSNQITINKLGSVRPPPACPTGQHPNGRGGCTY